MGVELGDSSFNSKALCTFHSCLHILPDLRHDTKGPGSNGKVTIDWFHSLDPCLQNHPTEGCVFLRSFFTGFIVVILLLFQFIILQIIIIRSIRVTQRGIILVISIKRWEKLLVVEVINRSLDSRSSPVNKVVDFVHCWFIRISIPEGSESREYASQEVIHGLPYDWAVDIYDGPC